ncbi:rh157 [macacine betaherpesvirus 3]|uniref:Rh157 n=1 Tax=Rhesus cytomegalovirus (strain 68-1) TaxID=47929 RepID=Q2FAE4_RHCM6|nr:rh157 [macacine betaherpesvirus 3]
MPEPPFLIGLMPRSAILFWQGARAAILNWHESIDAILFWNYSNSIWRLWTHANSIWTIWTSAKTIWLTWHTAKTAICNWHRAKISWHRARSDILFWHGAKKFWQIAKFRFYLASCQNRDFAFFGFSDARGTRCATFGGPPIDGFSDNPGGMFWKELAICQVFISLKYRLLYLLSIQFFHVSDPLNVRNHITL